MSNRHRSSNYNEDRRGTDRRHTRSRSRSPVSSSSSASQSPSPPPVSESGRRDRHRHRDDERRTSTASRYDRSQQPAWDATRSGNRQDRAQDARSGKYANDHDGSHITPPPPPRISKMSIAFGKPGTVTIPKPVQIKLAAPAPVGEAPKKLAVASIFNNESDDEEEMPAECRMRMRNIGRDTPTSSGPNSFGKTKQGFCDAKKIFEKSLRHASE